MFKPIKFWTLIVLSFLTGCASQQWTPPVTPHGRLCVEECKNGPRVLYRVWRGSTLTARGFLGSHGAFDFIENPIDGITQVSVKAWLSESIVVCTLFDEPLHLGFEGRA